MEIHNYQIEESLAQRHPSEVFRATNLSTGSRVALKIVRIESDDSARSVQELVTGAELQRLHPHPNICRVLEATLYDDLGLIAYEWLEGGDLLDRLGEGLDVSQIKQILENLGNALQHLHGIDVVHGDIKPTNILFRNRSEPVFTDVSGTSNVDGTIRIKTVTHGYSSPEAMAGQPVDGRADIYSLGIVLYRMLVGNVPWKGPDGNARTREPEDAIPDLPQEYVQFQPILESMLAYSRDERSTNIDFLRDVDVYAHESIEVPKAFIRSDLVSSHEIADVSPDINENVLDRTESESKSTHGWWYATLGTVSVLLIVFALVTSYINREPIMEFLADLGFVAHPELEERLQSAEALNADPNQSLTTVIGAYNRVLEIAPSHKAARQAIEDSKDAWKLNISLAIESNEVALAEVRLNEFVSVYPNDTDIQPLLQQLNSRRLAIRLLDDTRVLLEKTGLEDPTSAAIAIQTYREVLRLYPESEEALTQLNRLAQRLATLATTALREGDTEEALNLLDTAVTANPTLTDLSDVREEVRQVESIQAQITDLLDLARSYQTTGQLITPADENAAQVYQRVLALEPENQAAIDGLAEVNAQVLLSFLSMLEERKFEDIDDLIVTAQSVRLATTSISDMQERLQLEITNILEADRLYQEALELFRIGYISEPDDGNALEKLLQAEVLDDKNVKIVELKTACADRLAQVANDAHNAGFVDASKIYLELALEIDPENDEWTKWRTEWFGMDVSVQ